MDDREHSRILVALQRIFKEVSGGKHCTLPMTMPVDTHSESTFWSEIIMATEEDLVILVDDERVRYCERVSDYVALVIETVEQT